MKTRQEVARFVEGLFDCSDFPVKRGKHHFGLTEIRALMDFLYDGPPLSDDEKVRAFHWSRGYVMSGRDAPANFSEPLVAQPKEGEPEDEAAITKLSKEIL